MSAQSSTPAEPEDYPTNYHDYEPPENETSDHQSMPEPNDVLSMWESIPWAVESKSNEVIRKAQPLSSVDPDIMASLRAHDR
jgi:hypothetical protein